MSPVLVFWFLWLAGGLGIFIYHDTFAQGIGFYDEIEKQLTKEREGWTRATTRFAMFIVTMAIWPAMASDLWKNKH